MANKKTDRTGRYQIKANPDLMRAFDVACKQAGTNRSARIDALMRRDITPMTAEQMAVDLLPSELAREFKAACAHNGETITAALVTLVKIYIQYRGPGTAGDYRAGREPGSIYRDISGEIEIDQAHVAEGGEK